MLHSQPFWSQHWVRFHYFKCLSTGTNVRFHVGMEVGCPPIEYVPLTSGRIMCHFPDHVGVGPALGNRRGWTSGFFQGLFKCIPADKTTYCGLLKQNT